MTSTPFFTIPEQPVSTALSEREELILRTIIQGYVLTANPVGSAVLANMLEDTVKLSSATIRNVMAHLEELGYITHPHTSAGRIPTDKGYRLYVNTLTQQQISASGNEAQAIHQLAQAHKESALRDASKILGVLSHVLGVVQIPQVGDLLIQKLDLIALSSMRILVVIAFDSDVVRTITLEASFTIDHTRLDDIARFINERISGKTLRYVREHFANIIQDSTLTLRNDTESPLLRLFIDSVDMLFAQHSSERVHVAGAQHLLQQPEFGSPEKMRGVIELIENEDVIIHLLEQTDVPDGSVHVSIGHELNNQSLDDYSLVSAQYTIAGARCSVGLIGPKRMNYAKMIALVGNVAGILSTKE
ncbi:MAG: heat-inducible transcriptional repressor HrcA [Candidatus Kapaibacterium sp.]|nr:heat-inducible transcriptional repressor HrcA [Bacteroidota bacterium]